MTIRSRAGGGAPLRSTPERRATHELPASRIARTNGDRGGRRHSHLLATRQLHVIDELGGELDGARIPYWLIGGWVMDFHVGRISRRHSDVDLAVQLVAREALLAVIVRHGCTAATGDDVAGVDLFIGRGVRLGVTYIAVGRDGRLCTPGSNTGRTHRARSGTSGRRCTASRRPSFRSPGCSTRRRDGSSRSASRCAHDAADIHALRQLMSVFDPASAGWVEVGVGLHGASRLDERWRRSR